MTTRRTYRGNKIAVSTTQAGAESLTINRKKIDYDYDETTGMYSSLLAYLPAATLLDLGVSVVDEQLALEAPSLTGLKNEVDGD